MQRYPLPHGGRNGWSLLLNNGVAVFQLLRFAGSRAFAVIRFVIGTEK